MLAAEALAVAMHDLPVFLMGRIGMHGSSGHHAEDRHTQHRDERTRMVIQDSADPLLAVQFDAPVPALTRRE